MDEQTKEKLIAYLEKERDAHQETMHLVRRENLDRTLEARKELRQHSTKLAELAFGFGTAIIPLFFLTDKLKGSELFVFISAGSFLASGFVGFFKEKSTVEVDSNSAPEIGLDLEIMTYPRINALNKLIYNPENEEYQKEYVKSGDEITERYLTPEKREERVDFRLDIQYFFALVGVLFLTRTVWPFAQKYFWFLTLIAVVLFLLSVYLSYSSAKNKQKEVKGKINRLAEIRKEQIDWQEETIFNRKRTKS